MEKEIGKQNIYLQQKNKERRLEVEDGLFSFQHINRSQSLLKKKVEEDEEREERREEGGRCQPGSAAPLCKRHLHHWLTN